MKNRWTVARRLKKRRRQNQLKCTWENVKENKTSSWSKAGAEVKVRVVQNSGRGSQGDSSSPLYNTGEQGMGSVHCQLILPHTWHPPKSLLSLEEEGGCQRTLTGGLEQSQLHRASPAPSGRCAPGSSSGGQLTLRMVNASSEQFYPPTYSRYSSGEHLLYTSQEKQWNSFQVLDSTVESMLQDIPWLCDTFSLDLCYSPTRKRIASTANIPRILLPHIPVWLGTRQVLLSEATHAELYNSITGAFQAKKQCGSWNKWTKSGERKRSATSNFISSSRGLIGLLYV